VQISNDQLERILTAVQKPGRYVGGEWNSIRKDWRTAQVTLALAYPDVYEIGMSNLGLAILYDLVNRREDMLAERVYAPWHDMEAAMRRAALPLYSLETRHALADFDVIGLTLQHELTYTNVLNMLDLAGLPLLAEQRTADMPLVIAGGSCTYNPEPVAAFFDLFVLGEGEEALIELLEAVAAWKQSPQANDRPGLLRRLAAIPGIYVPSLYRVAYHADGTIRRIEPLCAEAPEQVRKRIVSALPPALTRPIVPSMGIIHDRAAVEIQRGCSRGCRFCQAGMIYRPIRERGAAEVLDAVDQIVANTGYDEVGLVSLSSSDHSQIAQIVQGIMERHREDGLAVSLPSLRIDSFSVELARLIQQQRKTGFTFAPEAGSQRLRDVINKGVTEADLLQTAEAAFGNGWDRIKLYFMLGLPTETDEDIHEMARLIRELHGLGRRLRNRRVEIGVSVATFVPKPHTPFQWLPLAERATVEARQRLLVSETRLAKVRVSWSDWDSTWLEALLSRGDRRLSAVVLRAWELGARFDAWSECYDPALWRRALDECGLDEAFYNARPRAQDEILPWERLDVGVSRAFLWREYQRALSGELSPDCRSECHGCGILAAFGVEAAERLPEAWGCP
jgi:radical SAM family uncharacterized protein